MRPVPPKLPILGLTQAKLTVKDKQLAHADPNVQQRAAAELAKLAATRVDGFKADGAGWLPKSRARIDVYLLAIKTTEGARMVQHALVTSDKATAVDFGLSSPDLSYPATGRVDFLGLDRKTVKALEADLGSRTKASVTVRAAEREAATNVREAAASRIAALAANRAEGFDWHNTTFESGALLEVTLKDGRQVASVIFPHLPGYRPARSVSVEGLGWAHVVLGFAAKELNALDLKLASPRRQLW